ncbi:unnamed protein product [Phytophthora lilii]|uniref:Unnamed protein product n=1 Tax=Phytophthora lilii TaxID=2077276 RepID=A0A9W6WV36_9STRA|nr:unnamed protein product [Phytophthora lilii]
MEVHPGDLEFQVIADSYIGARSRSLSSSNPTASRILSPSYPIDTSSRSWNQRKDDLKTNSSANMPTNSTADEALMMIHSQGSWTRQTSASAPAKKSL